MGHLIDYLWPPGLITSLWSPRCHGIAISATSPEAKNANAATSPQAEDDSPRAQDASAEAEDASAEAEDANAEAEDAGTVERQVRRQRRSSGRFLAVSRRQVGDLRTCEGSRRGQPTTT
jgi:hypothetical protein